MPKSGDRLVPAELGLRIGDMIPFEGLCYYPIQNKKEGQKSYIAFLSEGFDPEDKAIQREYRKKTINISLARFEEWTKEHRMVPVYFDLPNQKILEKGFFKITKIGFRHYEGEIISNKLKISDLELRAGDVIPYENLIMRFITPNEFGGKESMAWLYVKPSSKSKEKKGLVVNLGKTDLKVYFSSDKFDDEKDCLIKFTIFFDVPNLIKNPQIIKKGKMRITKVKINSLEGEIIVPEEKNFTSYTNY